MGSILLIAFVLLVTLAVGYAWGNRRFMKRVGYEEAARWHRMTTRRILGETIPSFSPVIQSLSDSFCLIYGEAASAESGKLDQVSGVAYGKALEFLIKDYAKKESPDKAPDIEQAFLSACIRDHIKDPALRESAQLAAWLRNDETHYRRKFMDKDVQDLKRIIALAVRLIEHAEERKALEANVAKFSAGMKS